MILNRFLNAQLQRLELEMKLTDIETESCAQIDKKNPTELAGLSGLKNFTQCCRIESFRPFVE